MNLIGTIFALVCGYLVFQLPRRYAAVPFLLGAIYMTDGQVIEIGPFHFTIMRLLVLVGACRIFLKHERLPGGFNLLDRLMVFWTAWVVACSVFHEPFSAAIVSHLGFAYNRIGTYFLIRFFIRSFDDFRGVIKALLIMLLPLAAEMISEKFTGRNMFVLLGGIWDLEIRGGKIRAQGPFAHSILAGTAGAVCLPLALLFWKENRKLAILGIVATLGMVVASASSGPILTTAAVIGGLVLWRVRNSMRQIRIALVLGIIGLALVMSDPVYYVLAKIDLTGSSTGWHRAALIDSALRYLDEWWFAGTDFTRHWMPTGIIANPNHTDITNVYIMMGVKGGLLLMFLFIACLGTAFSLVGKGMRLIKNGPGARLFILWTLGAILLGHAITFLSVDYFDQTVVLYNFILASVSALYSSLLLSSKIAAQVNVVEPTAKLGAEASSLKRDLNGNVSPNYS